MIVLSCFSCSLSAEVLPAWARIPAASWKDGIRNGGENMEKNFLPVSAAFILLGTFTWE